MTRYQVAVMGHGYKPIEADTAEQAALKAFSAYTKFIPFTHAEQHTSPELAHLWFIKRDDSTAGYTFVRADHA
jgi:hypothetical protein